MMAQSSLKVSGRVWKFGDQINTDLILPMSAMRLSPDLMHTFAFEAIRPGWVKQVRPGDLLVAGENFGLGSSRPIGQVLKTCGIVGVIAESINGLGYRNCINAAVPVMAVPGIAMAFEDGELAQVDFLTGEVHNQTRGTALQGKPLPSALADIVLAGGVMPMLVSGGFVNAKPFLARSI